MTEQDKQKRAKMYIDMLANGINPLDNTPVSPDDVVRHPRIVKCLQYVSDIIQTSLDREATPAQETVPVKKRIKRVDKAPFWIPPEKREDFAFSDTPIQISEFTRQLNVMIDEEVMRKIGTASFTSWLMDMGMLCLYEIDNQTITRPTEEGLAMGLLLEQCIGMQNAYYVILYSRQAQQMLLDNLDGILEYAKEALVMQGQIWDNEQDMYLVEMYRKQVPLQEIARVMKRNVVSVQARLRKLGYLI